MKKNYKLLMLFIILLSFSNISNTICQPITITNLSNLNFTEGSVPVIIDNDLSITGASHYGGGYLQFALTGGSSSDNFGTSSDANPNALGAISFTGNVVYLGNGSGRDPIGSIDGVLNGLNGANLRINFTANNANSGFESGNLTGWTVMNQFVDLGNTTIAGFASPNDASDNDVPWSGAIFTSTVVTSQYTEGTHSLQLWSQMTTANGCDIVHGPVAFSDPFQSASGDVLSFDWRAYAGDDAYSIVVYLLNNTTGAITPILNQTGTTYSNTNWATVNVTVPSTDTYRFVFVSGTYDATCGQAAGASLYIDNVKISGSRVTDAVITDIAHKITYQWLCGPNSSNRTLTVSAQALTGSPGTATSTLSITTVPATVTTGSYGPACSNDPDILLAGNPSGGIWTGTGVIGSGPYYFDPSGGTSTLTYTYCSNPSVQTTVTVYPASVGGTITGTSSIILGASTGTMTLNGYTGSVLGWEKKLNASGSWIPITNTTQYYSETPASIGKWYYRAIVQSATCAQTYSNEFVICVTPLASSFVVNGSATSNGNNCFTLTPDNFGQNGSVWFQNYLSLNYDFDLSFNVFLGSNDATGADGIAFVLQPNSTGAGSSGGGIGYQGITPSIAVEYDTWQNDDPGQDHISIQPNGNVNTNLASLGTALMPNIEDGQWHNTRITWDNTGKVLKVYWEGVLKLTLTNDLAANYFSNNPNVFWGFTSATGAAKNLHQFCVDCITFEEVIAAQNPSNGGSIAANQSGCRPYDPSLLTNASVLSGYVGTLEYKWQYSVSPFTSWTDIANNAPTYDPATITQTTKYKRLVKVTALPTWLESNIVTVTVNPQYIVTNTLNSGTGSLRDAIMNTCNGDTIVFAFGINGQNIALTSPIVINKNLVFDNCTHTSGITISGSGDNLIINSGSSIKLLGCSKFTVSGNIQNNAGVSGLVLNSGSSFIYNNCNLAATAKRDLTAVWHLFGSPFVKNTGAMFANLIPPSGSGLMMPYTNGTGWGTTSSSPVFLFTPSVGYAVKPSAFVTATLTGNLFCNSLAPVCDYYVNLVYNGTTSLKSWNLLANPYTSYLNWNLLGKTSLNPTLYLWDNGYAPGFTPITNASYMRTYNSANNVGVPSNTTPFIAPFQGFFVRAIYNNPKITFPLSARTHTTSTYYKQANTEILLRLKAETEEGIDELVICKNENASLGIESFDSEKLFNDMAVEIYTQSATAENLVINTINTTNTVIPLGINAIAGKKIKLTAFALEGSEQVYLEDRYKGKLISLAENTTYEFDLPTNKVLGRFFIRFNNNISASGNSDINVFENNSELNIIAQLGENIETVEVYTLTGACVYKAVGNNNTLTAKLNLTSGVYLARVKTSVSLQNIKLNWK